MAHPPLDPGTAGHCAKRALDIAVALTVLVLALPLLAAIALAVKLDSPGPILHRSWRAGVGGAPLGVLKFRKMHDGASGPPLTVSRDARLTRVGALLARTHLDELPQFWNVLVGDMSLVGPRPEDPQFTRLRPGAYEEILTVRPGLTGWSQLVWADEWEVLSAAGDRVRTYVETIFPQKVATDRRYVRDHRLASDLLVLLWTPLVLVLGFRAVLDHDRGQLRLVRRRTIAVTDVEARPETVVPDTVGEVAEDVAG